MILDDVNLEREFPHIMHHLQELYMGFIFQDPSKCNVTNWKPDARSHFLTVRGVEVPLTPSAINEILGTADSPSDVLTEMNISPPYQQIRHALCGGAVHCEMDSVWALWLSPVISLCSHESGSSGVDLPINIRAVLKSAMRKARVHQARVPKESVDYMAHLFTTSLDVTKTKGPENIHGPTLTTTERNRRDDMITAYMFGLEMLRSAGRNCNEVPLNELAEALLGLELVFLEPVWDDVPTDEDKR
ncbi:hypothetical protein H5410_056921 [Solanum commersonii]|uniref:Uncharacterized protein n=1 Tax=Solanum commersonii TaxID=4109 RepID=A0A9J5WLK0_SOLCO|nr:hypothetical protein H5410_056921 [Solanum commersonii]